MSSAARVLQALRSLFGRTAPPIEVAVGRVAEQSGGGGQQFKATVEPKLPEQTVHGSAMEAMEAARADILPPTAAARNREQHVALTDKSEAKKSDFAAASGFRTVRPHIPLIKFRKGGRSVETPVAAAAPVTDIADEDMFRSSVTAAVAEAKASTSTLPASSPWRAVQKGPIEFYELPEKYRRRPIDELECDIINMGGRDKPFE